MTSNNKHNKQGKQVKDRSNRNVDKETQGCDSQSSFLLKGTTSSFGEELRPHTGAQSAEPALPILP